MSDYFDGFFACALKPDTSQQVIDTLQYMTRKEDYEFTNVPDHQLFKIEDWRDFLRNIPDYELAPGLVGSELKRKTRNFVAQSSVDYYEISFRRSMHDDVEFYLIWWEFLDWIAAYSDTEGFVGYYREVFSLNPVLIYFKDGRMFPFEVKALPDDIFRQS